MAIVVRDIPNKGRGYIAQRDIKPGEIILEEQPIKSKKFQGAFPPHIAYEELANALSSNHELSNLLQFDESQGIDKKSKALAQVKLNSFLARDPTSEDSDVYMLQLDPKGSFFNHSCFPNAASHLRASGGSTVTIAISSISAGEEVCICYKTEVLFLPKARRQQLLEQNWGFTCSCSRCQSPLPNDALLMQGNMTANEANKDYDNLLKGKEYINSYEEAEQWVNKAKDFMFNDLHKAHWRKVSLRKWLIHFLLNPHFPTKFVTKYVKEQIETYNLLAPGLHNCKLELYLTFSDIVGTGWESQLQQLDPNAKTVLLWFASDKK